MEDEADFLEETADNPEDDTSDIDGAATLPSSAGSMLRGEKYRSDDDC